MIGWFDKRVHPFLELSQHNDHAWGHRVISLRWQELVVGGGIGRPPNMAMRRDSDLSWVYGTLELWRIGAVVSLSLAYDDYSRFDPLEQMGRCSPPRGGFTSRVVDLLTHVGYYYIVFCHHPYNLHPTHWRTISVTLLYYHTLP